VSLQAIRRTKIVATLGPSSQEAETIEALVREGVDCFRLNFSHGTQAGHLASIQRVRAAQESSGRSLAILADLQGPKVRVGTLAEPRVLGDGERLWLAGRGDAVPGDLELGFVLDLGKFLTVGQAVLINDGLIRLKVDQTDGRRARCEVVIGGLVTSHKGVNIPGANLPFPALTDDDRRNLDFALEHGVDWVALSFVRRAEDVEELRRIVRKSRSHAKVISKIELAEAIDALEEIVDASDGIMVARGDLGVEMGAAAVPLLQKRIIRLGVDNAKPVITATQMLETMIERPEPTRAEASDVANAILDGTSAVMLSAETAAGKYPLKAVAMMVEIARAVEPQLEYDEGRYALSRMGSRYIADVVGHAACDIAETLGAAAIVVPTVSGESAREVSKHRPRRPIAAASAQQETLQQLALSWAVVPIPIAPAASQEELWERASEAVQRVGVAGPGDRIVITSGTVVNTTGSTNNILVRVL